MSEGATAYRQFNGHLIPCNYVNLTNKSICNMFPKTKTRKKRRNEINMSIMETNHEKYEIKTCWNILFNKDIVIKWTWSNLYVHSRICGCAVICQKGRSKVLQWQTAMQTVRRREGFLTFARWVQQCSPVGLSEV